MLPIDLDDVEESIHDCLDHDMIPVEHSDNGVDWAQSGSTQSYQVWQCKVCKDYWGCRAQYDAGTGYDNRWHRFGPNYADIRRHY